MSNKQFISNLSATYADVRKLDVKKINLKGKNILDYIKDATPTIKHANDTRTTITDDDLWGQWIETLEDGQVIVHDDWVTNPNASIGYAWNEEITKVEDNKAYVGDTFYANIQTDKIKDGHRMFRLCSNLTTFNSDLSSLIDGDIMFYQTNLSEFTTDLSSLTNGWSMFFGCSNLESFTSNLSSLTNGYNMFAGCSNLSEFTVDLSSLQNGHLMFYYCSNLESFTSNLSSLTDGVQMFFGCSKLTTFTSDLNSLTNGYQMFYQTNLSEFTTDLSSLVNGMAMFAVCSNLESFTSDLSSLQNGHLMFAGCSQLSTFVPGSSGSTVSLSSLTNGHGMFMGCSNLTSFSYNLSSLINGYQMFYQTNLSEFTSDLSSLESGVGMFDGCSNLTTFTSDLSSLESGYDMFLGCSNLKTFTSDLSSLTTGSSMFKGCSNLTSFTSDLSSLTYGNSMFKGCKLDTESIIHIANSINTVTESPSLDIGIANETPTDEEIELFTEIHNKGWRVYVNGSDTAYVPPTDGTSLIPIDGEQTITPKPYWAKPEEVSEDEAEYVSEDGKFYRILGGQFIFVNDPESYGMFVSLEDAAANMRLTPYVKPQTTEEESVTE